MLYKLTKGTLSRIRQDKAGVDLLLGQGYVLDGECNEKYEIIDSTPTFDYSSYTVKELREMCDKYGYDHKGLKKSELLRLLS